MRAVKILFKTLKAKRNFLCVANYFALQNRSKLNWGSKLKFRMNYRSGPSKTSKKRTDSSFFIRVVRMPNLLIKQKIDILPSPNISKKLSQTSLSTWQFPNSVFQDPVLGF